MTQPIAHGSCCVWNTQTKILTAVALVALTALVLGIALTILQESNSFTISLSAIGGTTATFSALFLVVIHLKERKKNGIIHRLKLTELPKEVSGKQTTQAMYSLHEAMNILASAEPDIKIMIHNWEKISFSTSTETSSKLSTEELGIILGIGGAREVEALFAELPDDFQMPADHQISISQVNAVIALFKSYLQRVAPQPLG